MSERIPQPAVPLLLSISGELDQHRASSIIQEIGEKIDCVLPKKLVLDLGGLSFSDSSGIALLLRVQRAMAQVEGELEVINIQAQPRKLFQTAGLWHLISETSQEQGGTYP